MSLVDLSVNRFSELAMERRERLLIGRQKNITHDEFLAVSPEPGRGQAKPKSTEVSHRQRLYRALNSFESELL
jgi:hypothetical protein